MKKNTIYTLLCTTILIPGIALGMDKKEEDVSSQASKKVPQTPVSKIKSRITEIPKTPDVSTKAKEYDPNVYSPYSANYFAKRDIALISEQHAKQRAELESKAKDLEYDRELKRIEREEEELRNTLLEERRAELEASERKSRELDQAIENARLREEEAEGNLTLLTSQLEYMKAEAKKTAQLEAQLESMKVEVEKAQSTADIQRKQKTEIRESAEAEIKRRDEKIKAMEELVAEKTAALYKTKLEREKLKLEKETLLQLQALKINSEGATERKSNTSPQKLPEGQIQDLKIDSEDTSNKQKGNSSSQKSLDVSVPVSPQQPQSSVILDNSQPSGSVAEGTTKKKREVKDQTKTIF